MSAATEVAAGGLTNAAIGMEALLPATLDRDTLEWIDGWRRISMISHTTKGVKIRCAPSHHVDHSLKVTDLVKIRTTPKEPTA